MRSARPASAGALGIGVSDSNQPRLSPEAWRTTPRIVPEAGSTRTRRPSEVSAKVPPASTRPRSETRTARPSVARTRPSASLAFRAVPGARLTTTCSGPASVSIRTMTSWDDDTTRPTRANGGPAPTGSKTVTNVDFKVVPSSDRRRRIRPARPGSSAAPRPTESVGSGLTAVMIDAGTSPRRCRRTPGISAVPASQAISGRVTRPCPSGVNSPYDWTNHRPSSTRAEATNGIDGGSRVAGPGAIGIDVRQRAGEPGAAWKTWSCWTPPWTSKTLTAYEARAPEAATIVWRYRVVDRG